MLTPLKEAYYFARGHAQPLLFIALVYNLPEFLLELSHRYGSEPEGATGMIQGGILMTLGVIQFAAALLFIHQAALSQPISVGEALGRAIQRLMPLVVANLIMTLAVAGGLMLLVLPGLYLGYKLLFTEFFILLHNQPPLHALKTSYRLTSGMATKILPSLLIWLTLTFGSVQLIPYLLGSGDQADWDAIVLKHALLIPLSIWGWALIYRLYQRNFPVQPFQQDA